MTLKMIDGKKIHISDGNKKVGKIPSFSLPPVIACDGKYCSECRKYCYAKKAYRQYPSTKNAWDENFSIVQNDLVGFTKSMIAYFSKINAPRVFRIHVSGDFFSLDYLMAWVEIAKSTDCIIYGYTKSFDIFNAYFAMYGNLPKNLIVRASANCDCCQIQAKNDLSLPLAFVRKNADYSYFPNSFLCPAKLKSCDECGLCWKTTKNVIFDIH